MRYSFITLIVLFTSLSQGFAQSYVLKGSVSDTLNFIPLYRASVVAIRTSDTFMENYTRVGNDGKFELPVKKEGKYIINISFPGFVDYADVVTVNKPVTDLGLIPLLSKSTMLKEFVFTQQIAAIKIKGDTTEYVADSFAVKDNANVEALLKKLPGIQVDKDGKITAQGQTVEKILVDGEEFFSDDPKVVTQGLQANAVNKVQVYDKKSDQAEFTGIDDGEKTRTINLELKEDKKKGYFGKADVGGGSDGYFQNQVMANAFRGKRQFSAFGIVSNTDKVGLGWGDNSKFGGSAGNVTEISDDGMQYTYRSNEDPFESGDGTYRGSGLPKVWTGGAHFADKWNEDKNHVSLGYRVAKQNVEIDGTTTSTISLSGDTSRVNSEVNRQFNSGVRHAGDGMYEWKIDTSSSLKLVVSSGLRQSESHALYRTETWNAVEVDGPKTITSRTMNSNTDAQFINSSLLYRKKFAKKGRSLSLDLKENLKDSKSDGILNSNMATPGSPEIVIDQKKINNVTNAVLSARSVYTEPLSKRTFLEFNYSFTNNNSEALNTSYDKDAAGNYTVLRDPYSSDYKYNIQINRGGANFKFVDKKLNFSFGSGVSNATFTQTDLLHGDTSIRYNYINVTPQASLSYKVRAQRGFNLSYSGATEQPNINQIQPLQQNIDPLNITVGNPDLKQQFKHNANIRFNDYKTLSQRYIYASLSLNAVSNAISTSQMINGPVNTTTYVNVDGNRSVFCYISYGGRFIKKPAIGMWLSLEGNTSQSNNFINGLKNTSVNSNYSFSAYFDVDKEDKYEFNWNPKVTYNTNTSTINANPINYWMFNNEFSAEVQLPKKFEVASSVDHMLRQKTEVFSSNNQVIKWNASVSKKFLKKDALELKLSVYDILNQNKGITREAEGNTVTQRSQNSIRRYGMLSLIWNFTHTPGTTTNDDDDE
jgi:hypothetical protein